MADRVLPLHDIGRAVIDLVMGRGLPLARAEPGLLARGLASQRAALRPGIHWGGDRAAAGTLPDHSRGALEDAWFDLCFIPIRDKTGTVGGILVTVVEKTREVLGARRLSTLHQLTDQTAGASTWKAALKGAIAVLAVAEDVPSPWATGLTALAPRRHSSMPSGSSRAVRWRHR